MPHSCDTNEEKTSSIQNELDRKFLDERKVYLWGVVDDNSAKHVVERLVYLEAKDPGKEIKLYINSPGGVITAGMAILDTMHMISSPVSTICMGLAASMGALLLCAGEKGMRKAYPHSRIMIHQPLISGQIIAPALDLKIQAEEIKKTRDEINRIIAEASGKSIEQVEEDTDRDYYLNSKEAKDYGIIDDIAAVI
ncbi:MAG: ATP-dependent Clp protease proteolytic subunit [Spirochaetia bacterium]|nr:ATP-dependent Clp protease proteolytic subunit [Spirochaetia bacterium]